MKIREKRVWTEADIRLNEQSTTLTAQIHGLSCPACRSRKYAKSGKEKGNQRYICSRCHKYFRSTTGCTIHHLHLKPKIKKYIECMDQGLSLRKTAEKCDISLQTAFRWRHRFLNAMHKQPTPHLHENKILSTIVLPFSCKGKPAPEKPQANVTSILQIDTAGRTALQVLGKYGLNACNLFSIAQERTSHIASKSMPRLFKNEPAKCVTQEQIIQTKEISIEIHDWLAKFRGVASKFLANYWRWFMHIKLIELRISPQDLYMHNCF